MRSIPLYVWKQFSGMEAIRIWNVYLLGEMELGQPPVQHLCFVSGLNPTKLFPPSSLERLKQKNPQFVHLAEKDLGASSADFSLVASISMIPEEYLASILNFCGNNSVYLIEASSEADIQCSLERFAAQCDVTGMLVNASKMKIQLLSRSPARCSLQINGEAMKQFKYLGIVFTSDGKLEEEINQRIGVASGVLREPARSIMTNAELKTESGNEYYF
ncbi:unnamed protein product [Soboliphyme baturini]|uniref:Recombinase A n=1 Tax=Soboliphyme baturini TaxID=241478 RepID=A0A183IQW0_9BILA|nr:unnamed protein product [Soboliphyme baturini]